jgi:hypothetical protein
MPPLSTDALAILFRLAAHGPEASLDHVQMSATLGERGTRRLIAPAIEPLLEREWITGGTARIQIAARGFYAAKQILSQVQSADAAADLDA